MTKEELLKPRIKILHDWPGVAGKVIPGTIINVDDEFEDDMFWIGGEPFLMDKIRDYPYLFKELEWHECREEKDMPEYVKTGSGMIIKVFCYQDGRVVYKEGGGTLLHYLLPATKEEYKNWKNLKK